MHNQYIKSVFANVLTDKPDKHMYFEMNNSNLSPDFLSVFRHLNHIGIFSRMLLQIKRSLQLKNDVHFCDTGQPVKYLITHIKTLTSDITCTCIQPVTWE